MLRKLLTVTALAMTLLTPAAVAAAPASANNATVAPNGVSVGNFWFKNTTTGLCLTGDWASTYSNANVCAISNGYWTSFALSNGYYELRNGATGLCLSNRDYYSVYQTSCNDNNNGEWWNLEIWASNTTDTVGWMLNVNTGKYLATDYSTKVYLTGFVEDETWDWWR
jgi:hypothetical protein